MSIACWVPGDEVWVEDPGYPLTHAQLLLAKVRPHAISVDVQGLVVNATCTCPLSRSGMKLIRYGTCFKSTPATVFEIHLGGLDRGVP